MVSDLSFGLVAFSEINGILVLLTQTIVAFHLYPIILGKWRHISSLKHWVFNHFKSMSYVQIWPTST